MTLRRWWLPLLIGTAFGVVIAIPLAIAFGAPMPPMLLGCGMCGFLMGGIANQ